MCKSCLIYEIILFYYYFWDFFYELKKSCTKNPAHFCTRNAKSSTLRAGKIHTQKSQMKNCKLIYFRMLFFPLLWTTDWLAPTGSLARYYRTSSSSGYNAMHRKNFPKYSTVEWINNFHTKIFFNKRSTLNQHFVLLTLIFMVNISCRKNAMFSRQTFGRTKISTGNMFRNVPDGYMRFFVCCKVFIFFINSRRAQAFALPYRL